MSDYKKKEKEIGTYCILGLLVFAFVLFRIGVSAKKDVNDTCQTFGDLMQLQYKYVKRVGCFLKHEGNWIHKDNLRIIINK